MSVLSVILMSDDTEICISRLKNEDKADVAMLQLAWLIVICGLILRWLTSKAGTLINVPEKLSLS